MNLKHQLWMHLGRSEFLFSFFSSVAKNKQGISFTDKKTNIVIEGYPRCANTFAFVAFKLMQKNELNTLSIAHHVHGPMQIIRGVEYGVPSILLLREPTDAVVSLLIRDNTIRPKDAFKNYINFYQKLTDHVSSIVIADFEIITNDFKKIVEAVNNKYNTKFVSFIMDNTFLERCKAEVMEMDKRDTGNEQVDKTKVGIPSKERGALKSEIKTNLSQEVDKKLISTANQLYSFFKKMSIS